jgi:hypothetical protein
MHLILFNKQLSKNKMFELQVSYFGIRESRSLFNFVFRWTVRRHHAGPALYIDLLGLYFGVSICDCRHWDDEADDYVNS